MPFIYSLNDLPSEISYDRLSNFDHRLATKWKALQDSEGIFRYKLNVRGERKVPGIFGFVLQLNPERASDRRKPQRISSVKQPFNHSEFNFNKISKDEVLFELLRNESDLTKIRLLVNVSPITPLHSLVCPNVDMCLPQVVTQESLVVMADIMFLSRDRDLRIVYNSLCAMASVNHLHYHILEVKHRLLLENMVCPPLISCLNTTDVKYPAPAFCFEIRTKAEIQQRCLQMYTLFDFLLRKDIAHNIFITKGESFTRSAQVAVRFFVFPRASFVGVKSSDFNLAACEMAGYFPMEDENSYFSITEEQISHTLEKYTKPIFNDIVKDVKALFL